MPSASGLFEPAVEARMEITVLGQPAPKGSMRPYTYRRKDGGVGARMTNNNPHTTIWQSEVAREAFLARGHQAPIEEPVVLEVRFYFPRPKSAKKSVIVPAVSRNDIDKLLRAILDGLKTGGVYKDDGQVTDVDMKKRFAGGWGDPDGPNGVPRAVIRVGRIV